MTSSAASDAGFLTPVFGVVAVALGLIALASMQLARGDGVAERRDFERLQERYRAEGAAVTAAWRILHDRDSSALRWEETIAGQRFTILAEPEMRKLSIGEASAPRGRVRLARLLGEDVATQVAAGAERLSRPPSRTPSRTQLLALSDSEAWRTCGLSTVSAYSRLTDSAIGLPRAPANDGFRPRAGEVWRVVVSDPRQVIVDHLIRFTGDAHEPAAVIDAAIPDHSSGLGVLTCVARIQTS